MSLKNLFSVHFSLFFQDVAYEIRGLSDSQYKNNHPKLTSREEIMLRTEFTALADCKIH